MPDTGAGFHVGGSDLKNKWVLAGGALVAGILGYAYLHRAQKVAGPDVGQEPVGMELPPADLASVSTGGGTTSTGLTFITTNAEWSADATSKLVDLGFDSIAVSTALGKYLANQLVTAQEAQYIYTAIALSGHPPVGTFSVRLEPTPTSTSGTTPTTTAPKKYTRTTATWSGHRVSTRGITLSSLASQYAHSRTPTGILSTLRAIDARPENRAVVNRYGNLRPLAVGTIVVVPLWR